MGGFVDLAFDLCPSRVFVTRFFCDFSFATDRWVKVIGW